MGKGKFLDHLEETAQDKSNKYKYRSGRKEVLSNTVDAEIMDKIERIAYHHRKNKSEVINELLHMVLDGKDFEPVPNRAGEPLKF